jgi:hypothetical protein
MNQALYAHMNNKRKMKKKKREIKKSAWLGGIKFESYLSPRTSETSSKSFYLLICSSTMGSNSSRH